MADYTIKNDSTLVDIIRILDHVEQNRTITMSAGAFKKILLAIYREIINETL